MSTVTSIQGRPESSGLSSYIFSGVRFLGRLIKTIVMMVISIFSMIGGYFCAKKIEGSPPPGTLEMLPENHEMSSSWTETDEHPDEALIRTLDSVDRVQITPPQENRSRLSREIHLDTTMSPRLPSSSQEELKT